MKRLIPVLCLSIGCVVGVMFERSTSMSAQTTRRADSDGPQPHHHDWSSRWPAG